MCAPPGTFRRYENYLEKITLLLQIWKLLFLSQITTLPLTELSITSAQVLLFLGSASLCCNYLVH